MNFLFLMNSLESIIYKKDTSFVLMLEAQSRGIKVFYLPNDGITHKNGKLLFNVIEVEPQLKEDYPFIVKESKSLSEDDVDALFIRTDPPFDEKYLINTWLLSSLFNRVAIINNPSGIRTANEKIWAAQFLNIVPNTLIGNNKNDILSFLSEEKEIIAKPTNGFGGQSVFKIDKDDTNAKVILETLSNNFSRDIVCQEFVKDSVKGDKRILLLDGEFLGAVLRVHAKDEHRNNFFSGGTPTVTELTEQDKKIIDILKPELKKLGLYFVGIDIIGDYLIEVNVTSPTCVQEINRLYNVKLEAKVIDFAVELVTKQTS
ncbi:MAG: glutathione synthase [Candidatus Zapsychrus exili]|nr:glutathione synthase [Candidatus Zapsychrus exili]